MESSQEPLDESPKGTEQPRTCIYPPIEGSSQSNRPPTAMNVFFGLFSRAESDISRRFKDSVAYCFKRHDRGYCVSTITSAGVGRTRFGADHFRDVFRSLVEDGSAFPPVGKPTADAVDFDLSRVSFKVVDGIMREVEQTKRMGGFRESEEVDPVVRNSVVQRSPDVRASDFTGLQGSSLFWSINDYATADVQRSPSSIYSDLCAGLENYCNMSGLAQNSPVRPSSAPASIATPTTPFMQNSPSRCDGSPFMTYRTGQGPAFGLQRQTDSSPGGSSIPSSLVPFFYQYGPPSLAIPPGAGIQSDRAGQFQPVRQLQVQPRPFGGATPFPIDLQRGGQTTAGLDGGFAKQETPSPQNRGGYSILFSQNNNVGSNEPASFPSTPTGASKEIVRREKKK